MKACVLHKVADLRYEDVTLPPLQADAVTVKVRASGICGSDIQRVWQKGTYAFPMIPGHEFAGEIVAVGENADAALMGQKATVFPLLPCRICSACQLGAYAQCTDYDYFGSRRDGGFAELINVPVWNLVPAPDTLSFEEAAMTEPAAVALHALRQAGLDVGDTVAVFGAGPIGLMVANWARLWGADKTILVDIDEAKLQFAQKLGFDHTVNAAREDAVNRIKALTSGHGADVAVEGAGVSATLEQCLKCVRIFGKVVAMGNPAGDITLSQKGYWELLRKQIILKGTWNSSFAGISRNDWQMAVDYMAKGRLNVKPLITHRFPLEKCADALAMMRDKTEFFNKVMIVMD